VTLRPSIHVLTLGVADLERSLAFCRALGFESEAIIGTEFPGGTAGDVRCGTRDFV
jgi:catechol 2,3-dioxygenase-like lactoylglutathione lyase family enzyme